MRRAPPLIGRLVETFSFLAVGTSFIGTTLSLSGGDWLQSPDTCLLLAAMPAVAPAALASVQHTDCPAHPARPPCFVCRDAADRGAAAAAGGVKAAEAVHWGGGFHVVRRCQR